MQHTFFVHFFAVVLHDYNVKLSETSCFQLVSRFIEEMSHVSLLTFFLLAHRALIFTLHLVAASISYFLSTATKFSCCSFNKISVSFVFYPPPPPLSLSLSPSPSPPLSLSRLSSFTAFFLSHHMKFFPAFFLGIDDFLYHF